jgi:NhaA family Na+:H+ antiporter
MKNGARRWLEPLRRFLEIEAASGIVLGLSALIALSWASSPWAETYFAIVEHPLGTLAGHRITPHRLVDDGLMTIFFFVVGLEIRRELAVGELSDAKRAALPAIAALGGMIAPALVYLLLAGRSETRAGWGIPTATDIAFAVGVLSLLGRRVPPAMRVLLLALAVIDDLGAILVIAIFYTHELRLDGLAVGAVAILAVLRMQRARVQAAAAYLLPGIALWLGALYAGIHPTIAGVVLGLLTPVTSFDDDSPSPSLRWSARLHPWVAYGAMPLFAFANAGVPLGAIHLRGSELPVMLGVALGLLVGKPLGITLACAIALRTDLARAPEGLSRRHLVVLGVVGGVGFTMALFVSGLAFDEGPLLDAARAAVLAGSALAGGLGVALGWALLPLPAAEDRA